MKNPGWNSRQKKRTVSHSDRLLAYLIDWCVGSLVMMLPMCLYWCYMTKDVEGMADINLWKVAGKLGNRAALIAACISLLAAFFYYVIVPWVITPGQTFGKRMRHFRIVRKDGGNITPGAILLRQVVGIIILEGIMYSASGLLRDMISMLAGVYVSGWLMAAATVITAGSAVLCLITPDRRMLHDYIGGTKTEMTDDQKE